MQSFPDGFLWGTATAAHQVEGASANSDWSDWEQQPGRIRNQDRSTVACDCWKGERYRGDLLAKSLITLHHFTNPRWLAAKRAWENRDVVPLFERYAARAVQEFGDLCDFWITINEPTVYVYAGYLNGNWPPGRKDVRLAMRVGANMLRAHAAAYDAIHRLQPNARVGVAHSIRPLLPQNPRSRLNRVIARMQHHAYNNLVLLAMVDGRLRFPLGMGEIVYGERTE
ncbi:MAG: family 1 glycosylhydrolase [Chloroflexi bacterium]|nr:family 1 glycosylhydrolase [Chloroflexota bacterium]